MSEPSFSSLHAQAVDAQRAGSAREAEALCARALALSPGHVPSALLAARLATARGAAGEATRVLQAALDAHPAHEEVALQLALAHAAQGDTDAARTTLERLLEAAPHLHEAWLILGVVRGRQGDAGGALKAAHQAVTRAQRAGAWLDQATTPRHLLPLVTAAIAQVRAGRRELFFSSFAALRDEHGPSALARVEKALRAYLGEIECAPRDAMQRPRFLHFPDLPDTPFHDPALQPWHGRLRDAFPEIRDEALAVLAERAQTLPDFIAPPAPDVPNPHLDGAAAQPRWQAHFFYRRGRRYDEHHRGSPRTSEVLESIELCRVAGQAPEICFSYLQPQTRIRPHHGVTNTRLVMHLPLQVPPDCALHLVDRGVHVWQPGVPVMFDDTYLHEAWNRSEQPRVILLMDCWNPHLTAVERQALAQLVEMIASLNPNAAAPAEGH